MPASFGKYYDLIDQGNTYILSTAAAGTALPIITGTAGTFALWNTTGDKKAILHKINIGFTSGTIALGEFGLGSLAAPATSIATGGVLTAFADATPGQTVKNAKLGAGNQPAMRVCAAATTTFTASMAFPWYWLGSSITAATGAQPVSNMQHELDGLVVMPGQLVFLGGSVAQTGLFTVSLMFSEVPI
jgi:hypothetical protein